jgi:hypothetical protein
VITETQGRRTVSRRAMVLDYGFMPGAENELESLLRAWCAELAALTIDTLSIFTSAPSAGSARISSLGYEVESFNMWSPGIAEGRDALQNGLYVDAIYF